MASCGFGGPSGTEAEFKAELEMMTERDEEETDWVDWGGAGVEHESYACDGYQHPSCMHLATAYLSAIWAT